MLAAKLEADLAGMFHEAHDYEEAVRHYERALRFYAAESGGRSAGGKIRQRLATLHREHGAYRPAVAVLEEMGKEAMGGTFRLAAREHFFHALLCHFPLLTKENMAETLAEIGEKVECYSAQDNTLRGSREAELITSVCSGIEISNAEAVRAAVQKYNEFKPLEDEKINLLFCVLELLENDDER